MQPRHQIPARSALDYDETPFLAIWEVTQYCGLAFRHCRAAAQPLAHPDQLTTAEGKALIDQIAAMHIFVLTGGDPLRRTDVFQRHSAPSSGIKSGFLLTVRLAPLKLVFIRPCRQLRRNSRSSPARTKRRLRAIGAHAGGLKSNREPLTNALVDHQPQH